MKMSFNELDMKVKSMRVDLMDKKIYKLDYKTAGLSQEIININSLLEKLFVNIMHQEITAITE